MKREKSVVSEKRQIISCAQKCFPITIPFTNVRSMAKGVHKRSVTHTVDKKRLKFRIIIEYFSKTALSDTLPYKGRWI